MRAALPPPPPAVGCSPSSVSMALAALGACAPSQHSPMLAASLSEPSSAHCAAGAAREAGAGRARAGGSGARAAEVAPAGVGAGRAARAGAADGGEGCTRVKAVLGTPMKPRRTATVAVVHSGQAQQLAQKTSAQPGVEGAAQVMHALADAGGGCCEAAHTLRTRASAAMALHSKLSAFSPGCTAGMAPHSCVGDRPGKKS